MSKTQSLKDLRKKYREITKAKSGINKFIKKYDQDKYNSKLTRQELEKAYKEVSGYTNDRLRNLASQYNRRTKQTYPVIDQLTGKRLIETSFAVKSLNEKIDINDNYRITQSAKNMTDKELRDNIKYCVDFLSAQTSTRVGIELHKARVNNKLKRKRGISEELLNDPDFWAFMKSMNDAKQKGLIFDSEQILNEFKRATKKGLTASETKDIFNNWKEEKARGKITGLNDLQKSYDELIAVKKEQLVKGLKASKRSKKKTG